MEGFEEMPVLQRPCRNVHLNFPVSVDQGGVNAATPRATALLIIQLRRSKLTLNLLRLLADIQFDRAIGYYVIQVLVVDQWQPLLQTASNFQIQNFFKIHFSSVRSMEVLL